VGRAFSKKCPSILAGLGWAIGAISLGTAILGSGSLLAVWADERVPLSSRPVTGAQLYQWRWQALQQGQLYGDVAPDQLPALDWLPGQLPTAADWQQLFQAELQVAQSQARPLVLLLGDSLTLWLPLQGLDPRLSWLNQGISGETSDQIGRRLSWLRGVQPLRIYLMAGINDLKQGRSPAQVVTSLQRLIRSLQRDHPQSQLVVQSLLPTDGQIANRAIQTVNAQLAAFCLRQRCQFLNLYPDFADPTGRLLAPLATDGLHLSPAGYARWRQRLAEPAAPAP
jgi:lysophospholipase L1-like esterase